VFADADFDNQIAARRPTITGFSFTAKSQLQTAKGPCRHLDFESPANLDSAMTATLGTRVGNHASPAATGATGLLHPEETLAEHHNPVAIALPAQGRLGAPLVAAAAALVTVLLAGNDNLFAATAGGLNEVDLQAVAQVPAAARAAPPIAKQVTEEITEQVEY
jgi:hypothetical protein